MSYTATRPRSATWAFWIGRTALFSRTPSEHGRAGMSGRPSRTFTRSSSATGRRAQLYALGLALAADCPDNDCRVYLNIFNGARELDAALDSLDADSTPALYLRKALRERVGELAEMFDGNFAVKQYRKEARA